MQNEIVRTICQVVFSVGLLLLLSNSAAQAQVAAFKKSDIGTGATGSYSYSSGTYTVNGAGLGIGTGSGTADNFTMASYPATGNVEIIAKVTGQGGTGLNPYSQAGIMVRNELTSDSQSYLVSVSPSGGNGVNFTARTTKGGVSNTTLGPSLAAPIWLRLVVSGQDIAAYQSADSSNWVLVGKAKATLSSIFYVGLAVSSNQSSVLSSATFQNVGILTAVPQRNQNMLLWLRSDAGLQSSGSNVTRWVDQSQFAFDAVPGSHAPTSTASGINGAPIATFAAGSSQSLVLPSGFSDFSQGQTVYVVVKPTTTATRNILDLSDNSTANEVVFDQENLPPFSFNLFTSGGTATFHGASAALTNNSFQLMEATTSPDDGTGAANSNVYRNGTLGGNNNNMFPIENITRTTNLIGARHTGVDYFTGSIAELLILNKEATTTERQLVERYMQSKYGFGSAQTLSAPSITPLNKVLASTSVEVTITSPDPGAIILYTVNGSTPDPSSSNTFVYTGPFTSSTANLTVKAMTVQVGLANSAVSTSQIRLEPSASTILKQDLQFWLRSDTGVVLNSSTVSAWYDVANGNVFQQSNASKQPAYAAPDPLFPTPPFPSPGIPSVGFTGSQSMQCTTDFHAWPGVSIFMVVDPTDGAPSGTPRFLDIGNGSTTADNLGMSQSAANDFRYFAYNGSTIKNCTYTGGLALNSYQLIEATEDTSQVATVYKDGVQGAQTTAFSVLQDTPRTSTYIGASSADSLRSKMRVVEVIVYARSLTTDERASVEGYLYQKYRLQVTAPTISPGTGMYAPTAVMITADSGAQIYYTTDGSNPVVGNPGTVQYTGPFGISVSTQVKAIAVQSFGTSSISAAYIGIDANSANVPTSGLQSWLRSDIGLVFGTSPNIASWVDLAKAHTPTATSPNQPTLVTNVLNGFPAVNFSQSPTSQVMTFPGTFNFTNGFSAFVVNNIATPGATADMLSFSNGTKTVKFTVTSGGALQFSTFNSATQSVASPGGSISLGVPQLFEVVQTSGTATLYRNGQQIASGSVVNSNASSLTTSQISNALNGQYVEMLIFDHGLTTSERLAVEGYLLNAYQMQNAPIADPIFSVTPPATFSAPTQVTVSGPLNSVVRYTTDNTAVTSSSPILQAPINVSYTQTIRAKAFLNNIQSNEVSGTFTLSDSVRYPPPGTGTTSPVINLQLPTTAQ